MAARRIGSCQVPARAGRSVGEPGPSLDARGLKLGLVEGVGRVSRTDLSERDQEQERQVDEGEQADRGRAFVSQHVQRDRNASGRP